jgi:hypothetical protein
MQKVDVIDEATTHFGTALELCGISVRLVADTAAGAAGGRDVNVAVSWDLLRRCPRRALGDAMLVRDVTVLR